MSERHPSRPWSAMTALYLALLAVKPLYAVFVALVPIFLRLILDPLADILGSPVGPFHASPIWLGAFALLTLLTALLAFRYASEASHPPARMEASRAVRFAVRKLATAWVLLDSISFYGVASKVLGYSNGWCYGFVIVSALLTAAAGQPLLALRKGPAE